MFNEGVKYSFETIAESTKWINEHYPNGGGLYGYPRWGIGVSREEDELYHQMHEENDKLRKMGKPLISLQDLVDKKYGIQRYEI